MGPRALAIVVLLTIAMSSMILAIPSGYAQLRPVVIQSVTPSNYVYPGQTVKIVIGVAIAGIEYNVSLRSCYPPHTIWASVVGSAPSAGTYVVLLRLPKVLPGIGTPACLEVAAYSPIAPSSVDTRQIPIAPLITVNATRTPVIQPNGNHVYINVTGYGFDNESVISRIVFFNIPNYIAYAVWSGTLHVDNAGTFSIPIDLIYQGEGLPRGLYNVTVISNTTYINYIKNANLTIVPQIIVTPNHGHGKCLEIAKKLLEEGKINDAKKACELLNITIEGYGFDINANITEIGFYNTNFSIWYNFSIEKGVLTDSFGHFIVSGSKLVSINMYNMTVGMYNFTVIERPPTKYISDYESITFNATTPFAISPVIANETFGTPANVTAQFYVEASWKYKPYATRNSYTKSEVLRVQFVENNVTYELDANLIAENWSAGYIVVQFVLYNMSNTPPTVVFNTTVNSTSYSSSIGAYYAELYFNVTNVKYSTTKNASYRYHAIFYDYPNMIYLTLERYELVVPYASLTIYYNNTKTGKFMKWFYVWNSSNTAASNLSYSNGILEIPSTLVPVFIDDNILFVIAFEANLTGRWGILVLAGTPIESIPFPFHNVYYVVRPLLEIVAGPSVIMPGSTLTLAAYGFGPAYKGHNYLRVTLDKNILLAIVPLGKDGNKTFTITLPNNITYGAHYIWGRDSYGYEYSLAIIIGSKAYWIKLPIPRVFVNTSSNIVTAGYNGRTLIVCPYSVHYTGNALTYKVRYTGKCDYLGDKIEVVVSGLSPGDIVTIYFGSVKVATAIANSSGIAVAEFTVPTLPEGSYRISVVTPYGTIYPQFFNGTMFLPISDSYAIVKPKIVLTDLSNISLLPVLVGPGIVRVIGTGFPVGVIFDAVLINGTDAATQFAANVRTWTTDNHGQLISTGKGEPALYLPLLQPGAYEISLVYTVGSTTEVSAAGVVYVVNNVSIVATSNELAKAISTLEAGLNDLAKMMSSAEASVLSAIKSLEGSLSKYSATLNSIVNSLNSVSSKVESLASQVSDLKSYVANEIDNLKSEISAVSKTVSSLASIADEVKTLKSSIASLTETATKIEDIATKLSNSVSSITSTLSSISTKISDLSSAVSTIESSLSTISSTVSSNAKAIAGLSSSVSTLKSQVSTLSSTLSDVKSAISTIESSLSSVSKTVNSVASTLSALSASVSDIKSKLGEISSSLSTVSSNVASLNNKVSSLSSEVSNVKSSVASLQNNVKSLGNTLANVKSSLSSEISSAKKSLQSSLGTVQVLVIVALILALIAAVASIFGAIQISRKLAG